MRPRYKFLSPAERQELEVQALARFLGAGHSFADTYSQEGRKRWISQNAQWAWEREHLTWLERWSGGWYGMTWRDHRSMFKSNYLGHRNACLYVNGPKFYLPARRGPLSHYWKVKRFLLND